MTKPPPYNRDYRANHYPGAGPSMGIEAERACLQRYFERICQARLADNECLHGSLPGDRKIGCKCWGWPAPTRERLLAERKAA